MEKSQTEAVMEASRKELDLSKPIQDLFDECLKFISVNDFNV